MTNPDIQTRNRELAQQLMDEVRRDPQSPYAGKFVGIANGEVVVVADSAKELGRRLREAEPDATRCFCVEPSRDDSEVIYVWELR